LNTNNNSIGRPSNIHNLAGGTTAMKNMDRLLHGISSKAPAPSSYRQIGDPNNTYTNLNNNNIDSTTSQDNAIQRVTEVLNEGQNSSPVKVSVIHHSPLSRAMQFTSSVIP